MKILNALTYAKRRNERINGNSITYSPGVAKTSYSVVSMVTCKIDLATEEGAYYDQMRDFFNNPRSAIDYNPNSPYSVY